MRTWLCVVCGWIYDEATGWPADGIAPGTKWEDIPEDWVCPECQVGKADFEMLDITDALPTLESKPITEPKPAVTLKATIESQPIAESQPITESEPTIEPIVIIGSGHAGYQLASALRKQSQTVPITLFTADDGALYSKPALSNALSLNKDCHQLLKESALSWEKRLNIRLYPHTKVTNIDSANKTISTNIGDYGYGRLVLATGATPIVVPVAGEQTALLSINDLADYRSFRDELIGKKHVTILGDGLIGCEFANDLAAHGVQVTVVGRCQWPMQRLIPQQLGEMLQHKLSTLGVDWHLQNSIRRIQPIGGANADVNSNADTDTALDGMSDAFHYQITLDDGQQFHTDLVLSAVGLTPNVELAQSAGIHTSRGIHTNKYHQTSDASIYALGDCAAVEGEWMPYIKPINQAIPALASSLLGKPMATDMEASAIIVKTPIAPLTIMPAMGEGRWQVEAHGDSGDELAASFYNTSGQLTGFALLGASLQRQRSQWTASLMPNQGAA